RPKTAREKENQRSLALASKNTRRSSRRCHRKQSTCRKSRSGPERRSGNVADDAPHDAVDGSEPGRPAGKGPPADQSPPPADEKHEHSSFEKRGARQTGRGTDFRQ